MQNIDKLIKSIENEISELIESESNQLTRDGQYDFYILFKNCKYLKELDDKNLKPLTAFAFFIGLLLSSYFDISLDYNIGINYMQRKRKICVSNIAAEYCQHF